jgi:AbrB family looped-hinge helix DNA binding protein
LGHKVGTKGQIVIEKAIREELGIQPWSVAVQRVVDGRLEISFKPARHRRSLAGAARPFIARWPDADDANAWDEAIADGIAEETRRDLRSTRS